MSYGNYFTEIPLDSNEIIILSGKNGMGKSTFSVALYFVTTGKILIDVNKSGIVNNINKKNCLVELEFKANNKTYLVRRGISPNIFEIYEDDILIPEDGKNVDFYQEKLEKILSISPALIKSIILINSSLKSFFKLTKDEKRKFNDELFGLQKFNIMLDIEKKKAQKFNASLSEKETELLIVNSTLVNQKESLKNYEKIVNTILLKKGEDKKNIELEIKEETSKLEEENSKLSEAKTKYNSVLENLNSLNEQKTKQDEIKSGISTIENKITTEQNTLKSGVSTIENKITTEQNTLKSGVSTINETIKKEQELTKIKIDSIPDKIKKEQELTKIKIDSILEKISEQEKAKDGLCPTCNQEFPEDMKEEFIKKIKELNSQKKVLESEIITKIKELNNQSDKIELELTKKIKELNSEKDKLELDTTKNISELNTEKDKFRVDIIEKIVILNSKKENLELTIDNSVYEQIEIINKDLKEKENSYNEINMEINSVERLISKLKKDLENFSMEIPEKPSINIEETESKITTLTKDIEKLNEMLKYLKVVNKILLDGELKAYIVSNYIPFINEQFNKYLEMFNFDVKIKFDSDLEYSFLSKKYKGYEYGNFSSGQKTRLNLALLFAFIELHKMINYGNLNSITNMIVIDEFFDSGMDNDGIVDALEILETINKKTNTGIFIISHKLDCDKIDFINYEAKIEDEFSHLNLIN